MRDVSARLKAGGALVGAVLIAWGIGFTQGASEPNSAGGGGDDRPRYSGTSNEGDLQGALDAAIAAGAGALSKGGADHLLEYEIESIRGRHGGFAGFDQVTVTIRASNPPKAVRGGKDR